VAVFSRNNLSLTETLDTYIQDVEDWLKQLQKEMSAVKKLKTAVQNGEVKSIEALRKSALKQSDSTHVIGKSLPEFSFDSITYLSDKKGFMDEIKKLAHSEKLSMHIRDDVIFSYPLIIRIEPELNAIRINKKLRYTLRPDKLVDFLLREQTKDPSNKPSQFIEALFKAYRYEIAKSKKGAFTSIELLKLYNLMTILPGTGREYTRSDFARDLYFLDVSDVRSTRSGHLVDLTYSTASRERGVDPIEFVTRDGTLKYYHSILFTAP